MGCLKWEDIGGLVEVKRRLRQAVEWPLQHKSAFDRLGISAPRGVLLYGPPGCSKTTLARAAASASGATMLPLSCAQLYSMYVGEGESALRETFRKARLSSPSIIFLDEVDAVAGKRSKGSSGSGSGSDSATRLLSPTHPTYPSPLTPSPRQAIRGLLRPRASDPRAPQAQGGEVDGHGESHGNSDGDGHGNGDENEKVSYRWGMVGRLDVQLMVPPPGKEGRGQILGIHTRQMPLDPDVDLQAVAEDTANFSGAELAGLCREAAIAALREDMEHGAVAARHFRAARAGLRAGLTPEVMQYYEEWNLRGT
eukprot:gene30681-35705_t